MTASRHWLCTAATVALLACSQGSRSDRPPPAATSATPVASSRVAASSTPNARIPELLVHEDTRATHLITDADLASGDPLVKRAAARALARAENPSLSEKLLASLADDDPDVLAWSAYGLGRICAKERDKIVARLVARAMNYRIEPPAPPGQLDPWIAIAGALGKCASTEAEITLVNWLSGPKERAVAATYGLGTIVSQRERMEEETAAALLRATRGDATNEPLFDAFFPFGRIPRAPVRVQGELRSACAQVIEQETPARAFVMRALGTLGEEAAPLLGSVARSKDRYGASERADAARALGKIQADAAQRELLQAIAELAPVNETADIALLVGPGYGALSTALRAVRTPDKKAAPSKTLEALTALEPAPDAPLTVVRRVALLRCTAARILAGGRYDDPKLVSCDPQSGAVGALARLAALDRGDLAGPRFAAWSSYLDAKHSPVVRSAALRLLANHAEVAGAASIVEQAIADEKVGVVAEAAQLVASHPERFRMKKDASKPEPGIADALLQATTRQWPADALETVAVLAKACGAMRIDEARPWLTTLCSNPSPTLRTQAKQALALMGGPKPACETPADQGYAPASELRRIVGPTTVELDTDVGKLTLELDSSLAPVAATRIVTLFAEGFYNDMAVHRVVPGFVVQFGDRDGDGYGGAGLPALRCETSPVPFRTGTVGIALSGRDTGSSQVFVTLGPTPHLNGDYAVVGTATGPWDVLVEGDRIKSARIMARRGEP